MREVNYTEFRENLAKNLDTVINKNRKIQISRSDGKKAVLMSMSEYNSIHETIYLNSTSANRKQLAGGIREMNRG